MATAELLFQLRGDPSNVKQVLAQVRAELSQTQKSTESINKSELSARSQIAAAQSLQRQRSAALITQWKQQETAARQAAAGTRPFGEVLQGLTQAITTMQGPLGGVASRVTSLTGLLSGLALGAGAVAIAIGAMAAAAVGGAIAFFRLVQSVSQATGKFHDLSQQVGVSVETLSTLSVLASTTGGNIDTVTASLALFQRNLEDSHDPTSKEAKLLKELGVTSLNTEVALRQVIRGLFALGEGAKQTDASIQLFGRSGRFVNAILKESKGDVDAATERFQKMGLIIGGPAAAAADRFNDSLEILERQLGAITRTLVSDTIPVFIAFFEQLSGMLTRNKDDWQSWSRVVETSVAGVLASIQGAILAAATGQFIDAKRFTDLFFDSLIARSQQVRNEIFAQSEIDRFGRITDQILGRGGRPGDRPDADNAKSQAQARANKSLQLQQQALEEQTRKHREALERERDLEIKNADQWEIEAKRILEDHRKAQEAIFAQELVNARQFVTNKEDLQLIETEIQQKRVRLANDVARELLRIEDEAQKRNDQIVLKTQQGLFRVNESFRQGQIALQRRLLDEQSRTESDFLTAQLRLLTESHEERKKLFKAEEEQASLTAARLRELNEERAIAEQEFTNQFEDFVARRIAAREREIAAEAPGARGVPEPSGRVLSDRQIGGLGQLPDPGPTGDVFRDINRVLVETLGLSNSVASSITDVLSVSFGNLANAVGDAVRAFVLFGSVQGGFKRFAAEVIASIAQMAIVQAVWEAAQGLAMLALGYFTSNPKFYASAKAHFAAAAAYGLIGGVAAVAGRAVAGNSFSGGGTSGEGGSRERPQPLTTIISGKNQAPNPTVRHVIDVRVGVNDSEFGRTINAHIVRNVGDGGELREVIQRDGR